MAAISVEKRPWASALILTGGFIFYCLACAPAMHARDLDLLDPFYLALRWAWPGPLLMSAWFDGDSWRRWNWLAVYALAVALPAAAAADVYAVPRFATLMGAVPLAPLVFVFHLLIALPLEFGTQCLLGFVRRFSREDGAHAAGMSNSELHRMRRFLVGVTLTIVGLPLLYRAWALADARANGRWAADLAWREGRAILHVRPSEFMGRDSPLFEAERSGWDPVTGLKVEWKLGRFGRRNDAFHKAYRAVVAQKLAESGPAPTTRYLFTAQEVEELLQSGCFHKVEAFPLAHGRATIRMDGRARIGEATINFAWGPKFMYSALVEERGGVLIVATDQAAVTFSPEGEMLQKFSYYLFGLEVAERALAEALENRMP